jgi:pimeloyl-ACP methyl ester carboxylesterase
MAFSETIAECLPPHLVQLERFPHCGHGVHVDEPEWVFDILRKFIVGDDISADPLAVLGLAM